MTRDEILNMPADRELDALIAEKVMGYKWYCVVYERPPLDAQRVTFLLSDKKAQSNNDGVRPNYPFAGFFDSRDKLVICEPGFHDRDYPSVPAYSTAIAAAWEVVEFMHNSRYYFDIGYSVVGGLFIADFRHISSDRAIEGIAQTAPLAICRAALLAVMECE